MDAEMVKLMYEDEVIFLEDEETQEKEEKKETETEGRKTDEMVVVEEDEDRYEDIDEEEEKKDEEPPEAEVVSGSGETPPGIAGGEVPEKEEKEDEIDEEVGKRIYDILSYELSIYVSERSPYRVETRAFMSPEALSRLFRTRDKKKMIYLANMRNRKKIYSFSVDFSDFVNQHMALYERIYRKVRQEKTFDPKKLLILIQAVRLRAMIVKQHQETLKRMEAEREMMRERMKNIQKMIQIQKKIHDHVSGETHLRHIQENIERKAEQVAQKTEEVRKKREEVEELKKQRGILRGIIDRAKQIKDKVVEMTGKVVNAVKSFFSKDDSSGGKDTGGKDTSGRGKDTGGPDI